MSWVQVKFNYILPGHYTIAHEYDDCPVLVKKNG